MNSRIFHRLLLAPALPLFLVMAFAARPAAAQGKLARPQGPCDIYAAAGDPCVAADSTTRALYASYDGPLYQVMRQSDGRKLNIGVVEPTATDPGGYADAAAQDRFCANTYCWITTIYDQSPKHNNLTQPPRGGWSGPALGGMDNLPLAEMAPVTLHGHKVYGVFIEPGMGMRDDDPSGTAVDDQAEGQYWVVNGHHFNDGCCFDYGNAEIDSRDDDNGTMEATYFGDATPWYHGSGAGPWVMTDQENNLVGCVNKGTTSKLCANLPTAGSRFVTGIAKGEPHHWSSMGGNSQHGPLSVIYSGARINSTYDPMRKQGAILLGNGGDNSNGSQGTFYEGAMTAAGTYPSNATDQKVQANIVAAGYAAPPLVIAPASATAAPTGLQTFAPGSSRQTTLTFTNTTGVPASDVTLSLQAPAGDWAVVADGTRKDSKTFAGPVAPGATVSATFRVTSGPAAFNGDLRGRAAWTSAASGHKHSFSAMEKVRNVAPVRINEFRISSGSPLNPTNSFIELYNSARHPVNLSGWTLTEHPAQQAIFSSIKIPAGTTLAPGGFYLMGLSDSGLAAPASAGDKVIHVRSVAGMSVGDTLTVGAGSNAETRKIAGLGTAAANHTTIWQPLPQGPIITIPAGSTNVPVMSVAGFAVGQKIALGYGTTYPAVARDREKYEVATVTAVGKPGVQEYLAADASAGSTNIKVTSVDDISVGDKIRLDINSVGHGIETITVKHVGTAASRTNLAAAADKGATSIQVGDAHGFAVGDKIIVGDPATWTTVTITSVGERGRRGATLGVTPALPRNYAAGQAVVAPGTGLELEAPLKFNHSANLPFSDRGTGISFEPATAFAHSSDEPVQALGTGITLDRPLARGYGVNAVVRDAAVKTAGYHGAHAPQQWFGGPELVTRAVLFGRYPVSYRQGSMVLRDAAGHVVDSLNYGGLVDPWAAEGYQGVSGQGHGGCFAPAPGSGAGNGPLAPAFGATNVSAGRYPDGADTDSNCNDFFTQTASTLAASSAAGDANLKVLSVDDFVSSEKVMIGEGAKRENAVIATVGTAGATTLRASVQAGAKVIPVAAIFGFMRGQTVSIGKGANAETAVIASIRRYGPAAIVVTSALTHAHAAGTPVAGSGITLAAPLAHAHAIGTQIGNDVPTPGAANQYSRK